MNNYDVLREQTTQGLVGFSRALLSLVLVRGDGGSSQNDSRVGFLVAGHRLRTADPHCTGDTNDKLAQISEKTDCQAGKPLKQRLSAASKRALD